MCYSFNFKIVNVSLSYDCLVIYIGVNYFVELIVLNLQLKHSFKNNPS